MFINLDIQLQAKNYQFSAFQKINVYKAFLALFGLLSGRVLSDANHRFGYRAGTGFGGQRTWDSNRSVCYLRNASHLRRPASEMSNLLRDIRRTKCQCFAWR